MPAKLLLNYLNECSPDYLSASPPAMKGGVTGTHRMLPPEETLRRLDPVLGRAGITRIANVTGLDCIGIPVVMVCRPNSRSLAVSQGKGLTLAAAKASGVMEAIELHHAENTILPLRLASLSELKRRHSVADAAELPHVAGGRFHPNLPLLWAEGYDLQQMSPVFVPYELVHMNTCLPDPSGSGCFAATSNGLASGNHLIEAINHAIFEIIERDAATLWHLLDPQEQRQKRIDLSSIENADCRGLLDCYRRADMKVMLWDMTSDVAAPAFRCLVMENTTYPDRLVYFGTGMGCHSNRDVALVRALTEAAQSRLTLIAGSRDDVFREEYQADENLAIVEHFLALQATGEGRRSIQETPTHDNTMQEDLTFALERLRCIGLEQVIMVNLTDPCFNIPVVRMIIPGLEGSSSVAGYVPGKRAQRHRDKSR